MTVMISTEQKGVGNGCWYIVGSHIYIVRLCHGSDGIFRMLPLNPGNVEEFEKFFKCMASKIQSLWWRFVQERL